MSSIAVDGGGPLTEKKPPRKKRKMIRPRKKEDSTCIQYIRLIRSSLFK